MRRTETPETIWIKFCTVVDIPDIVTYTNFGDHRLRGFWVAGGEISPSPVDFHRRPYNTLASHYRASVSCNGAGFGENILSPESDIANFERTLLEFRELNFHKIFRVVRSPVWLSSAVKKSKICRQSSEQK